MLLLPLQTSVAGLGRAIQLFSKSVWPFSRKKGQVAVRSPSGHGQVTVWSSSCRSLLVRLLVKYYLTRRVLHRQVVVQCHLSRDVSRFVVRRVLFRNSHRIGHRLARSILTSSSRVQCSLSQSGGEWRAELSDRRAKRLKWCGAFRRLRLSSEGSTESRVFIKQSKKECAHSVGMCLIGWQLNSFERGEILVN
jgi:hypothetical protein